MKSTSRNSVRSLTLLCTAVYFCSYLTRINYAAVMVEMIAAEGFTKSGASVAVTGLFITYGVGQIISGFLGDRLRPHILIFGGLLISSGMNIAIPFCPNTVWMTVFWCINGFAQAMMWPPLVRIMSDLMSEEEYKKATVLVSWGSSFGTMFIYLTAPLYVSISSWKLVFFMSALFATAMAFLWMSKYKALEARLRKRSISSAAPEATGPETSKDRTESAMSRTKLTGSIYALLAIIMFAIIMQGTLRDGIITWMPTYISETFQLDNAVSILTGVVLPIFNIISIQAIYVINRRLIQNELTCSAVFFAVGAIALLVLMPVRSMAGIVAIIATVLALAIGSACMHGVNVMLICMVPRYFQKTGKISLISGVLNSCTYVGSALATYGVALLTDRFGWNTTVLVWILAAIAGALACILPFRAWWKFRN